MSLTDVQSRIAHLQARFATPARTQVISKTSSFTGVLAEQQAKAIAAGSPLTMVEAPAPASNASWVRGLPDAGKRWSGEIQTAAQRNDLDPRLLAALVQQESGFRADAVSHAGARGLAQLMPGTAAALGVDPDVPSQNLEGGARYLREQLDRFGRVDLALAAYNAGPTRVAKTGGIPPIAETQTYVVRVMANYERLTATSGAN